MKALLISFILFLAACGKEPVNIAAIDALTCAGLPAATSYMSYYTNCNAAKGSISALLGKPSNNSICPDGRTVFTYPSKQVIFTPTVDSCQVTNP